jgi:hypothetical protein
VRDRSAEQSHDRVADELLDRAAVPLELAPQAGVVRREKGAYILRVEPLGATCEADEVGEEHGQDLSLFAGLGLFSQGSRAREAEVGDRRILLAAARADQHE